MITGLTALILAAGKGTRMRSPLPKVLHSFLGQPLLHHVMDAAGGAGASHTVVVVGYGAEDVRTAVESSGRWSASFAIQTEQLGTGHAVMCGLGSLPPVTEYVMILSGDVPGIRAETLAELVKKLAVPSCPLSMLTFWPDDPTGYGRVLRDADGRVRCIREEKDASPDERRVQECNAGVYVVAREVLDHELVNLGDNNASGEIYLTDLVEIVARTHAVETLRASPDEVAGVNTPEQLEALERRATRSSG